MVVVVATPDSTAMAPAAALLALPLHRTNLPLLLLPQPEQLLEMLEQLDVTVDLAAAFPAPATVSVASLQRVPPADLIPQGTLAVSASYHMKGKQPTIIFPDQLG